MSRTGKSEILLYLQGNKLAFHSFMDVGIRHEISESETKSYLSSQSPLSVVRVSTFLHWFHFALDLQAPNPIKWNKEGLMTPVNALHYRKGTLTWGNMSLLPWTMIIPIYCFREGYHLYLPAQQTNLLHLERNSSSTCCSTFFPCGVFMNSNRSSVPKYRFFYSFLSGAP